MRSPPNGPAAGRASGADSTLDPASRDPGDAGDAADSVVSVVGVTKTYQLGGTVTALDDVVVSL